jgi:hypothetical protein
VGEDRSWIFGADEVELTPGERFRWGTCPVCRAPHGTPCYAAVGLQVGRRLDGAPMRDGDGAHLGRLQAAPRAVRVTEAR